MKSKDKKTVGYTENTNYRCLEEQRQVNSMSIVSPLNLDYCGIEQCEPGHIFESDVRENYEVHIILKGRVMLQMGKRKFRMSAGEAFIIYPGQEEAIFQADGTEPWEYMWVGFHGHGAKKIVRFMGFTEEYPLMRIQDTEPLRREIEKMLEARELTFVNMLKRSSALYALISMMIEENPDEGEFENPSNTAYVNEAVEIMMQSYSKKLKISDIATTIGISRNYLTDLFKHEFDMSPQSFLMNFRMEKAAQELIETDELIQNVGINVGYSDPLAFSKAFKQKYGMSPSAYRTSSVELVQCDMKREFSGWPHL